MMNYTTDIIIAICTVIGTVVTVSKILGKRFDKIDNEIKEIKKDIGDMKVQLGKLETRVEERTFRVQYTKTGTQEGT